MNKVHVSILLILSFAAGLVSYHYAGDTQSEQQPNRVGRYSILEDERKIVFPKLVNDDGNVVSQSDFENKWSILFFGYTNCPDVCPTTMNALSETFRLLGDKFPLTYFVSVDPDRDKEPLKEYVDYFNKEFIGMTGDAALLKALTLQMNAHYKLHNEDKNNDVYSVDHTASIYLINPRGKLHAFINPPFIPEQLAVTIQRIKSSYK